MSNEACEDKMTVSKMFQVQSNYKENVVLLCHVSNFCVKPGVQTCKIAELLCVGGGDSGGGLP